MAHTKTPDWSERGRFLFVVPPLPGHINPTIGVGHELAKRGHVVAWAGHTDPVADLLLPSDTFFPVADALPPKVEEHKRDRKRGPVGLKVTWEEMYLPVTRQMFPGVSQVVDDFEPDVLVVDQQAWAGVAAAEHRGLPWVTSASTPAGLIDWFGMGQHGKLREWHDGLMQQLMMDMGIDEARLEELNPNVSPHLMIFYTVRELLGLEQNFPDHYAFVGPSLGKRGYDLKPFPWEWLDESDDPCVLVSLGTLNWYKGQRFFSVVGEALADMDVRAIFVAPEHIVPDPPPNVLVGLGIPQVELLPRLSAVVSHGGQNTVAEALSSGLPLVVSPIGDDQPMIADQVVKAGAGLRVKHFRLTAEALRDALHQVLTEPTYREAAKRLRAAFEAAGGATAAADRIEAVMAQASVGSRLAGSAAGIGSSPGARSGTGRED